MSNEALRLAEILEGGSHQFNDEAAALLRQQAERIAELEADLKVQARCMGAGAERELALMAEVERLRVDAERWEWIADGNNFDESFALLTDPKLTTYELTKAVDHARTTHKD